MIGKALQQLLLLWQSLSGREQRLAMMTAVVVALMAVIVSYQRATERLDTMDRTINQLEDDLVSYSYQLAHREMVESRYAEVAAQHSSEWTEAEIHDRLRQEIYRLARRVPPPLDDDGIPINMPDDHGNLVEIPSLGRGIMAEGGQGYREYIINLRIPPSPLENIINFLERLQQSPQSLRIDSLELNRATDGTRVTASFDISRIVADGAPSSVLARETVSTDATGRIPLRADGWQGFQAAVTDKADAGAYGAVEIRSAETGAEAWMTRNLPGGAVYEMILDIYADAPGIRFGVGLEDTATLFDGAASVSDDGVIYRYHVQFTLPDDGASMRVRCPWIQFENLDAAVHVSNILLRRVSEV